MRKTIPLPFSPALLAACGRKEAPAVAAAPATGSPVVAEGDMFCP